MPRKTPKPADVFRIPAPLKDRIDKVVEVCKEQNPHPRLIKVDRTSVVRDIIRRGLPLLEVEVGIVQGDGKDTASYLRIAQLEEEVSTLRSRIESLTDECRKLTKLAKSYQGP